jgi:hypothetical protein
MDLISFARLIIIFRQCLRTRSNLYRSETMWKGLCRLVLRCDAPHYECMLGCKEFRIIPSFPTLQEENNAPSPIKSWATFSKFFISGNQVVHFDDDVEYRNYRSWTIYQAIIFFTKNNKLDVKLCKCCVLAWFDRPDRMILEVSERILFVVKRISFVVKRISFALKRISFEMSCRTCYFHSSIFIKKIAEIWTFNCTREQSIKTPRIHRTRKEMPVHRWTV